MNVDMSQFFQVFFEEAAEHLASMEALLLKLDVSAPDLEEMNAIFRAAHSIKGGAGTFGFTDMVAVTHELETLLDKLRKQELALTADMVDAFLAAKDVVGGQLAAHQGGDAVSEENIRAACKRLKQLADRATAGAAAGDAPAAAARAQATTPAGVEGEDYGFFDDVSDANADAVSGASPVAAAADDTDEGFGFFSDAPAESAAAAVVDADAGYGFFGELPAVSPGVAEEISADSERAPRAAIPQNRASDHADAGIPITGRRATDRPGGAAAPAAAADTSIRVSVDKVDQLINLVGELVITQAMLAQTASRLDPVLYATMMNGMGQLERNTRDLQESVMSIRMMPIAFVFSRFPRLVRELAGKLDKQVELKTVGEGTELDKGLIEKIADPLTHLVRNSLDHGIESPQEREAAGKPAKGTITLSAYHQGGNVIIDVADDGAGLSRSKILAKAKERGMNVHDDMPDQEVWQLIFEAGFSTATVVTDVSGRGVGMDVVKRNIFSIGGRVEIDSAPGLGTRMSVRLPLTLAILDGMSVAVGKEVFIVPLTYVVESLQAAEHEIKTVSGQGRVVHVRGEYLPLTSLHQLFNIKPAAANVNANVGAGGTSGGIVMIVEAGGGKDGGKHALLVDALLGQHQVVIKSLQTNYRKVVGVSGATIMGDGHVALILDVGALVKMSRASEDRYQRTEELTS